MGEVIEVPGLTEEALRNLAIEQSLEELDEAPPLRAREFTLNQWRDIYMSRYGYISDTTARRKLNELVERGILAKGKRKDPQLSRRLMAYWKRGEAGRLSGDD